MFTFSQHYLLTCFVLYKLKIGALNPKPQLLSKVRQSGSTSAYFGLSPSVSITYQVQLDCTSAGAISKSTRWNEQILNSVPPLLFKMQEQMHYFVIRPDASR